MIYVEFNNQVNVPYQSIYSAIEFKLPRILQSYYFKLFDFKYRMKESQYKSELVT